MQSVFMLVFSLGAIANSLRGPCVHDATKKDDLILPETPTLFPVDHLKYVAPGWKEDGQRLPGDTGGLQRTYQPSGTIVSPNFELNRIGAERQIPVPVPAVNPQNKLHQIIEILPPSLPSHSRAPPHTPSLPRVLPRLPPQFERRNDFLPSEEMMAIDLLEKRRQQTDAMERWRRQQAVEDESLEVDQKVAAVEYEEAEAGPGVYPALSYMPPSPVGDDWNDKPMKPLIKVNPLKSNEPEDEAQEKPTTVQPTTVGEGFLDLGTFESVQRKRWSCLLLIDAVLFSLVLAILLRQR
eukprot:Gregarina_sp_Poly_1__4897@NODE_25_length_19863_cov_179_262730_g23_i0_p8_GENE_NODE_25_length_19863_cov_179_262730_g23_i0NODE_25_length_19863_cov_179_262730_g23_i0_p8_ORF_typecomplete_len295_score59_87DUF3824/PF12868_7/0_24_NODE_25_length_19863_cov_179_262730_g23_i01029111175